MKLGLRTKGLLNYYAVGQYGQRTFLLKMMTDTTAKEITEALRQPLQSRCQDTEKVLEFEKLILNGMPCNGVPKGTNIFFSCLSRRLSVEIDGKTLGSIRSESLARAFQGIYTDTNKGKKHKLKSISRKIYSFSSTTSQMKLTPSKKSVCVMRPTEYSVKCGSQKLNTMIGWNAFNNNN